MKMDTLKKQLKCLKTTLSLSFFFLLTPLLQVKAQYYYYGQQDSVKLQKTDKYVFLKQDGILPDSSLINIIDTVFCEMYNYIVVKTIDSLDSMYISNYTTTFPIYKIFGKEAELGLTNEILFQLKDTLFLNKI
jgi:hypothetical protein